MGKPKKYGINTRALHTKKRIELPTGDVMSPLHLTSTYENPVPGESEYFYGRVNNPTREIFERTISSLEGNENYEEIPGLAMASGMASVALIAELIKPDENVVITKDVYGGTTNFFATTAKAASRKTPRAWGWTTKAIAWGSTQRTSTTTAGWTSTSPTSTPASCS